MISLQDGKALVKLARDSVAAKLGLESESPKGTGERFNEKRGLFVTITKSGMLRGCIGFPRAVYGLYDGVRKAAVYAAFEDLRFPPVTKDEFEELEFEVSVLTVPEPLEGEPKGFPDKIKVGRDGLMIEWKGRSGLLLPQVATEYGWDSREFLRHLCDKASLPEDSWQQEGVKVLAFQAQIFSEEDGSIVEKKS